MPNTWIRNAMIIDGAGGEAFKGSVYATGDRIEAVIPATAAPVDGIAQKEKYNIIDAEGLADRSKSGRND
jgi:adenine deaminase